MRWRILLVPFLALFVAVSCDQQPVEPQTEEVATPLFNGEHGNQVSGYAYDSSLCYACHPRGRLIELDANFSLTAQLRAYGTATGEWQDVWGNHMTIHVKLDCLDVNGNEAWFSGILTVPVGAYGIPAAGRVVDNGKSANDPPDKISMIVLFDDSPCTERPNHDLFDLYDGQVVVR